jgi:hypothetical protein
MILLIIENSVIKKFTYKNLKYELTYNIKKSDDAQLSFFSKVSI